MTIVYHFMGVRRCNSSQVLVHDLTALEIVVVEVDNCKWVLGNRWQEFFLDDFTVLTNSGNLFLLGLTLLHLLDSILLHFGHDGFHLFVIEFGIELFLLLHFL